MTKANSISKVGTVQSGCRFDRASALRRARRRALYNTLWEALQTFGLATCFLLCALLMSRLG